MKYILCNQTNFMAERATHVDDVAT